MRRTKTLRIGLTGPIGAGKSTVAKAWEQLGAAVVAGDEMGRLALETDVGLKAKLVRRFGQNILDSNGAINRVALAATAFSTAEHQQDLTRLTFPSLYNLAKQHLNQASSGHPPRRIVVFDAAMLFEWGVERDFDVTVTVTAPPDELVKRAADRLDLDVTLAERRLNLQMSPQEKEERADIVIMNDGDRDALLAKAGQVWEEIKCRLE